MGQLLHTKVLMPELLVLQGTAPDSAVTQRSSHSTITLQGSKAAFIDLC